MRAWQPSLSLLLWFRRIGMRPVGGFRKPCASTGTRARSPRTQGTATTADSNFFFLRGAALEEWYAQIWLPHVSRSTGPGSSTDGTATAGVSGEPPEGAGSAEVSA